MSTVRRGPLVIVAGPSGVGKSTVVDLTLALARAADFPLRRAVTATSRAPRGNEVPGVDYHYWSAEEFVRKIDAGEMLEHAVVFGASHYGTPLSEVEEHRAAGTGVILVIDVQGAAQVRAKVGRDQVGVFIDPPSFEELESRLTGRGTDTPAQIAGRLATAQDELARAGEFEHRIVNADANAAALELLRIIRTHRPEDSPCSTT